MHNKNFNFTKWVVNKAFSKALSKEMDYFDAVYTDLLIDKLGMENVELIKIGFDGAKFEPIEARKLIKNYKYSINQQVLEAYGWCSRAVENAIIRYLPEEYIKSVEKTIDEEM